MKYVADLVDRMVADFGKLCNFGFRRERVRNLALLAAFRKFLRFFCHSRLHCLRDTFFSIDLHALRSGRSRSGSSRRSCSWRWCRLDSSWTR